jgi:hypothetical protein
MLSYVILMVFGFYAGYRISFWAVLIYVGVLLVLCGLRVLVFLKTDDLILAIISGVCFLLNVFTAFLVGYFARML